VENLSNDLQVTAQTPPTFIFHTTNDAGVPVENSVRFYLALRKVKVPVEMHLFENGPHGVGMALNDPSLSAWPNLLMNWLRARGLLAKPASRCCHQIVTLSARELNSRSFSVTEKAW
jgi:acetyl esterase/lipase